MRAGLFLCHYCPTAVAETWDHVVPRDLGGSDQKVNLVPSCRACNLSKGSTPPTCRCEQCRLAVQLWLYGLAQFQRERLLERQAARVEAAAQQLAILRKVLSAAA